MITYGRMIKLVICIVLTIILKMSVEMPVFMFLGFAVFILVGFDIFKDKNLSIVAKSAAGFIMLAVLGALVYNESGMGEEFKYFVSFAGGCMVWLLGFDAYKQIRGKR